MGRQAIMSIVENRGTHLASRLSFDCNGAICWTSEVTDMYQVLDKLMLSNCVRAITKIFPGPSCFLSVVPRLTQRRVNLIVLAP